MRLAQAKRFWIPPNKQRCNDHAAPDREKKKLLSIDQLAYGTEVAVEFVPGVSFGSDDAPRNLSERGGQHAPAKTARLAHGLARGRNFCRAAVAGMAAAAAAVRRVQDSPERA